MSVVIPKGYKYPLLIKKIQIGGIEFQIRKLTFKEAMGIGAIMSASSTNPSQNILEIAQFIVHLGTVKPTDNLEQLPYEDYVALMNAILEFSGLMPNQGNPIINPSRRLNP